MVVEISGVHKTFRGKKGMCVEALKDVSLTLSQGEIFGFLGPNGSGKSTTIKILMGLIRATKGTARIGGVDCSDFRARSHVGYLPENPAFYDFLTAKEYLLFAGRIHGMTTAQIKNRSDELLELLDLQDAQKRPIRSYSKGMVQRLGLAQALLHEPDLYVLDEPMSGLDPIGRALVKNIILNLKKQGKTVFFSTHITSDVETVCDRVGILKKGSLECVKDVGEFQTEGITGYQVRLHDDGSGSAREVYVAKDELTDFLVAKKDQGIALVEPVRKHLEELFLDIVGHENE